MNFTWPELIAYIGGWVVAGLAAGFILPRLFRR